MNEGGTEFVISRMNPTDKLDFISTKESSNKINELEFSPEASAALGEIYKATDKIVNLCKNHPILNKEFKKRFIVDQGIVERTESEGFTVARTSEYLIDNYKLVKESGIRDESWLVETSLENLVTWIGLAAESHPAILGEINDDLDLERFGIQAERIADKTRPKVLLPEGQNIVPDELFSEQLIDLRKRITEKHGQEVCNSIVLCGGVARDVIQGKNPFTGLGDIDFALTTEVDDDLRENIRHEFTVGNINTPDDMTAKTGLFAIKMKREGWKDIYEGLSKNVTFSVDSIAVNLGTGEVFDPNRGVDDLRNGQLKLVGENKSEYLEQNPHKALILAIRGVRTYAQHALIPNKETKELFQKTMSKNKVSNIFNLVTRGLNKPFGSYEIPIMYVKMLEKAQSAMLIAKGMEEFGILEQVSAAINALNRRAGIKWNDKLLTIQDLLWQRDYKTFRKGKMIWNGRDIRHIDNETQGREESKFISTSVMLARVFSYLS